MSDVYSASGSRYDRMPYRRSGRSGLMLPALSLGFWHNFGDNGNPENMRAMMRTAFDLGMTQFDLANNYGPVYGRAEENAGRILAMDFAPYRDELVITSKAGYDMWPGPYGDHGSRKYLLASCDASLRRLGLDYVDIFYHHRPDPDTPLEETMEALLQIVRSGKAIYAGISNYPADRAREAVRIAGEIRLPLVVNQLRYNMIDRKIEEDGTIRACAESGLGIAVFSPLAQGLLTGKYLDGIPAGSRMARDGRYLHRDALTDKKAAAIRRLDHIAQERGQKLTDMALAWLLGKPEVTTVIIGASRPEQITENARCLENLRFSDEELKEIDAAAAFLKD